MSRLWRLAIGNWWTSPGRAGAAVLSVALGVAAILTITNAYITSHRAIFDQVVGAWLGSAHVTVFPPGAHWGSLDASLADEIGALENVNHVTARLQRRVRLYRAKAKDPLVQDHWQLIDAIGIDPESERPFRTLPSVQGRMFAAGERGKAIIEGESAETLKVQLGDSVAISTSRDGPKTVFTIVGTFDSRRIAEFQRPRVYVPLADLQILRHEPAVVSVIDVLLNDASPSAITKTREKVVERLNELSLAHSCRIETATGRQMALDEAERLTKVILMIVSFVTMLTSFFIIVTTQSMSLFQRRPQLGVMRCVGATRGQLVALLSAELLPLGILGTLLGLAGGTALTYAIAGAASDLYRQVFYTWWGVALAAGSGMITTAVSTLALIVLVGRSTPLEAVNTQAQPPKLRPVLLATGAGVVLLALHHWMVQVPDVELWLSIPFTGVGVSSLYLGYALLVPVLVVGIGAPIARVIGSCMGVPAVLADDPFLRTPWRTTGACWVLMVGLSLIVYIGIRAEGVLSVWNFPARLPDVFVWSPQYVSGEVIESVKKLAGVGTSTTLTDVGCQVTSLQDRQKREPGSVFRTLLRKLIRPVFVAGDLEQLLAMAKITFAEGSRSEALEKLARGGYVLIPPQTARNFSPTLHLGDRVTITVRKVSAEFEIAGVIESPTLDMAVSVFQAESYMQFASASAMLGTRRDLREKFGLDSVSMFMFDVELPEATLPVDFDAGRLLDYTNQAKVAEAMLAWSDSLPNERETLERVGSTLRDWLDSDHPGTLPEEVHKEVKRYGQALRWVAKSSPRNKRIPAASFEAFRERLVLLKVAGAMDRPDAIAGSISVLRRHLDAALKKAIVAITWLPSLLLVLAAVGIGNLMMVSVYLRSREIATLRAIGAVKSQIMRLVLAESATIGLLGGVTGVALGMHEAYSANHIAVGLIDVNLEFIIPLGTIALGVGLTVGVCLVAGLIPARVASRSNIIAALHAR